MSETSDLISELVREKDQYKDALEKAYQELGGRDGIIIALGLTDGEVGDDIPLEGLDELDGYVYEFNSTEDMKSGTLTIKVKE